MDTSKFSIFEGTDWSAAEEVALLNAIEEFGYGNWINISRRITTRTPVECQQHYNHFYINHPSDFLPALPKRNVLLPNIVTPYNFRLKDIEEPPRCLPSSTTYSNLAGYSAARSEFEYPYDSNAERIVTALSHTFTNLDELCKDSLMEKMACAVFRAYNNRLRERHRRYNIISEYGLILARKQIMFTNRYEGILPRHIYERFQAYIQFMAPLDFDFIMQSLFHQVELKNYLHRLKEIRAKGIRSFHGVRLYAKLKKRRDEFYTDIQNFMNRPELSLLSIENVNVATTMNANTAPRGRAMAAPLDIIGLPGFDRLSDDEKQLCSVVRLVPESFLEFKRILINECEKLGGLKLQDARKAIRIDVNKTRKLYDFLMDQGHITKPNVT